MKKLIFNAHPHPQAKPLTRASPAAILIILKEDVMKKLLLSLFVLVLFGCGQPDDNPSGPSIFPEIRCLDISDTSPSCTDPVSVGIAGLYSAAFISNHPVYTIPPTTLFFEVSNTSQYQFKGIITCTISYLTDTDTDIPTISNFSTSIDLASEATNTYSFSLSPPTALHTHGRARIIIDTNTAIKSYASLDFLVQH